MRQFDREEIKIKQALPPVEAPEIKVGVLEKIKVKQRLSKRLALIAAIVVLFLVTSGTAFALSGFTFEDLMKWIQGPFDEIVEPWGDTVDDQGIRMELVAISKTEKVIKLYIAMQDLTGDRVDEHTAITKYYASIDLEHVPHTSAQSTGDYDQKTKTKTNYFSYTTDRTFEDKPFTFTVTELIANYQTWQRQPIRLDLTTLTESADTLQVIENGNAIDAISSITPLGAEEGRTLRMLKPSATSISPFPQTDTFFVTNAGNIDGQLHVQVCQQEMVAHKDRHTLYLSTETFQTLEPVMTISATINEQGEFADAYDAPSTFCGSTSMTSISQLYRSIHSTRISKPTHT